LVSLSHINKQRPPRIGLSCKRHGKDPLAYLRDILTRLPTMTNQDSLDPLLPHQLIPQGPRPDAYKHPKAVLDAVC
jgi:IS66 C-terminal element